MYPLQKGIEDDGSLLHRDKADYVPRSTRFLPFLVRHIQVTVLTSASAPTSGTELSNATAKMVLSFVLIQNRQ